MNRFFFLAIVFLGLAVLPHQSQAGLLYTGAANQVVYEGETFVVEWYLDTQDQTVNSMDLMLTYTPDILEVVETSTGNSAIDLWVKSPEHDQAAGTIWLVGGISSGVSDDKLDIFRATFRPTQTGTAKISLQEESELLLADGLGSPTALVFNEVSFTVNPASAKPASITSSTHPDQDDWYQEADVELSVQPKDGEEYSYSFSANLEIFPDQSPDDVSGPIKFNGLSDGIYYFKLNSRTNAGDWQEAGVYRVKIDTTPPREFAPAIGQDAAVFDGQAFVSFNAVDSVSGVAYYEVKSNFLTGWQRTDDQFFRLPGLVLGDTISVRVVDEAGNERIEQVKVDKSAVNSAFSNPTVYVILILSVTILVGLVWSYFRLLRKYKVNDN